MRIVVMSDSHGSPAILRDIVETQTNAEVFIHLGDGERDFDVIRDNYTNKVLRSIRGNSDWGSASLLMDILVLDRKRVIFTHGHTFNVKQSTDLLMATAKQMRANVVLFGHTHTPMINYIDGIYLLNPGSVACPRRGRPSYGVVDITDAGIIPRVVLI